MTRIVGNPYRDFGPSASPPATPALGVSVNGTQVTAIVSGSTGGSLNSIYTSQTPVSGAVAEWTLTTARVGDGVASFSLPVGFYLVRCESTLAGVSSQPSDETAIQTIRATARIADYGALICGVRLLLAADPVLTDPNSGLLASYGLVVNGAPAAPSRANSIFGAEPPGDRNFPCITLWELKIGPALPRMHDHPMAAVFLPLQISAWGKRQDLRPIISEIDAAIEGAWYGGAMDTSDWKFQDIDTSGDWTSIQVSESYAMDSGQRIVQFAKVFGVDASNKNLGLN